MRISKPLGKYSGNAGEPECLLSERMKTAKQPIETDPVKLLGHVLYEIETMIFGMRIVIALRPIAPTHILKLSCPGMVGADRLDARSQAFKNLGLEAVLVHYRSLHYFVCNRGLPGREKTDLFAKHLAAGFGKSLPKSDCDRIHAEVSHLTKERSHDLPSKDWGEICEHTLTLRAAMADFLDAVSKDSRFAELADRIAKAKAALKSFDRPASTLFDPHRIWPTTTANPDIYTTDMTGLLDDGDERFV